ncbi:hypothetical protein MKZ38_002715 [Zalerion maritima]|uniref:Phospholipid-transporting ATPase n=1 Tax=Zalerion maritima TaxID=339359 RepID=A0AAD5RPF1_9PEZI|nr:hypothetical protein MKZ38_002715 [Zalerion maritima]
MSSPRDGNGNRSRSPADRRPDTSPSNSTVPNPQPPTPVLHPDPSVFRPRSSLNAARPLRRLSAEPPEDHRVRFSADSPRESRSPLAQLRHSTDLYTIRSNGPAVQRRDTSPRSGRPGSLTITPSGNVTPRLSMEERKNSLAHSPASMNRIPQPSPADASAGTPPSRMPDAIGETGQLENYWDWLTQKQRRKTKPRHRVRTQLRDWYLKIVVEGILRQKPMPPSKDGRRIPLRVGKRKHLIDERTGNPFISNFIRSSRYTVWDFLPKQLFFQFSKLANFYFLVIGIMQMIPGLSTTGTYTTIAPLMAFVSLSMAKEGWDDYRRYRLDKVENRSDVWVLDPTVANGMDEKRNRAAALIDKVKKRKAAKADSKVTSEKGIKELEEVGSSGDDNGPWVRIQWRQVRVGDVVRLRRDENVPADMVLLHATGPNGIAYIETMALDGETNLKSKQACPLLAKRCNSLRGLEECHAEVVTEDPNLDLYNFEGKAVMGDEKMPLTSHQVIYRGSVMRNTEEAFGVIVNSGEECKIRMNAHKNVHAKAPAMQIVVNRIVVILVIFVCLLSVGCTVGYEIWKKFENDAWYLEDARVPFKEIFLGFIIEFNTLIPLSLYVSLEIIKLGQLFLLRDAEMYHEETNTPMVANTTTILENLGQVSYVFSDKTGTLTENLMRFRKMSVAGTAWLHDMDLRREAEQKEMDKEKAEDNTKTKKKGKKNMIVAPLKSALIEGRVSMGSKLAKERDSLSPAPPRTSSSTNHWKSTGRPANTQPELNTVRLLQYLRKKPHSTFARKTRHFILCLALCHTCLPETKDDGEIEYQAASPDELALVEAAKDLGYIVVDRPAQTLVVQIPNAEGTELVTERYEVLDVIEFSSKRKRMSILIRMPDNRICMFTKGADSVILPRLKLHHLAIQKASAVERRASKRKSVEQEMALRRKSMHVGTPRGSIAVGRPSATLGRRSMGGRGSMRRSTSRPRKSEVVTGEVESWLRQRETEGWDESTGNDEAYTTPRHSMARQRSMEFTPSDDFYDTLVDESLAVNEGAIFERCFQHIDDFASEGLRTLLYAYRYVDEQEYTTWKKVYKDASTSLVNRQDRIEEAAEMIEQKFDLAGATAIEDKLQQGVPDTIDKLRRAHIKVWMLTGDKRETAINIAHSARICKPFSEIYVLDSTVGDLQEGLTTTLIEVGRGMVAHSVVVIDGHTLGVVEADECLKILFFDLVTRTDAVICCRAAPAQKATLVKCIRRRVPSSITLAIGDGANDIAMIQASHVGIGISGREGLQAARIADYSIAQFRFLQKLLFVHGRWNYIRTGKYILGTFWKELVFYLVQAFYQRYNGYTGTSLYEPTSLTVFNTLFTSLPVILLGIFEQDLNASTLLAIPELYSYGQRSQSFNFWKYLAWMFMASTEGAMIYFGIYEVYRTMEFLNDTTLYAMGDMAFTVCVIFINIKMLVLEMHTQTIITLGGLVISIGGWFLWNLILSEIFKGGFGPYIVKDAFIHNFGHTLKWWTTCLISLTAVILVELVVAAIRRSYFPTDQDRMQVIERYDGVLDVMRGHAAELGEAAPAAEERTDATPRPSADVGSILHTNNTATCEALNRRFPGTSTASAEASRISTRIDEGNYLPPSFTPLVEEKDDPVAKAMASTSARPVVGRAGSISQPRKLQIPTLNLRPPTSPAGHRIASTDLVESPGELLRPRSLEGGRPGSSDRSQ